MTISIFVLFHFDFVFRLWSYSSGNEGLYLTLNLGIPFGSAEDQT